VEIAEVRRHEAGDLMAYAQASQLSLIIWSLVAIFLELDQVKNKSLMAERYDKMQLVDCHDGEALASFLMEVCMWSEFTD